MQSGNPHMTHSMRKLESPTDDTQPSALCTSMDNPHISQNDKQGVEMNEVKLKVSAEPQSATAGENSQRDTQPSRIGKTEPVPADTDNFPRRTDLLTDSELEDVLRSLHKKPDIDKLTGRTKIKIQSYDEVKLGAEVSFGRFLYKHHGVVIQKHDDLEEVVILHVTGDSSDSISGSVSSKTKADIAQKKIPYSQIDYQYNYGEDNTDAFRAKILCRAKYFDHYYHKLENVSYSLRKYNCEHFASFIVNGQLFCNQVGGKCCFCFKRINDDKRKYLNSQLLEKLKKDMGERYVDTHARILQELLLEKLEKDMGERYVDTHARILQELPPPKENAIDGRCWQCCGCGTLFCTLKKDAAQNIEEEPIPDEIRLLQEHFDRETVDSICRDLKLH